MCYLLSIYYTNFEFIYPVCVVFIVHCDCPATSFYGKRYVLYGIYCSIAFISVADEYDALPQSAACFMCKVKQCKDQTCFVSTCGNVYYIIG